MERYRFPLIVAGIVVVVLLVAYMAWISPEGSKLSTANAKKTALVAQEQSLAAEITHLKKESGHLLANCTALNERVAQIPSSPDEGVFLTQIDALASSTGTTLPGYSFSVVPPSSTSSTAVKEPSAPVLPAITVTLNFSGTYSEVTAFLNGLDKLGRLYAVNSYSLKQSSPSSLSATGAPVIISSSTVPYSVTLIGTIYFNPTQNDVCAKPGLS